MTLPDKRDSTPDLIVRKEDKMTSEVSRAIGQDEPVMIAWLAFKNSDAYANCLLWTGKHSEGNLWTAFVAGWKAANGHVDD